MDRSECKYGSTCYRRNKQHFLELSHPFIEEIAAKINSGEIEAVMSLGLNPGLLEQAQLVAELLENEEITLSNQKNKIETAMRVENHGVKRPQIASAVSFSEEDSDECHHKAKKIKNDLPVFIDAHTDLSEITIAEKVDASAPFRYFLSAVSMIPETWTQPLTLKFSDLLHPSLGLLQESVQINFMVELGWLLAQYCQHGIQRKPLLVIYGVESEEMLSAQKRVPTIETIRVKPKYPFGSHHTKMAMMSYKDGSLRIVVHTGNLIESDWEDRTQGIWVSPSCPPSPSEVLGDGYDSITGFKRDLLRYLETYSLPALQPWIEKIRLADMSSINVCFIPSAPGSYHLEPNDDKVAKWGHPHLSWLLQKHASAELDDPIVMQCSSIGSLGPSPSNWLLGELAVSMAMVSPSTDVAKLGQPKVQVIYPCFEDVKSSLHGLAGGGCLPYSRQGHNKQPWFTGFLYKWRSETRHRTKAIPHIKSYTRLSSDMKRASWFILTSGNLSKAAWGMHTKKGETIMIQSFEAGVLFLPKFINGEKSFELGKQLALPYDIPLTKYGYKDEPWFMDQMR